MKKLLTSILTIALFFSINTSVSAEGEIPTPETEENTLSTVSEEETRTLPEVIGIDDEGTINQSVKVVLDNNYRYHSIYVNNGAKVTIDLNGYELMTDVLACNGVGTELTIIDSKATSKPIVSGYDVEYTSGKIIGLVIAENNSTIFFESGTIQGELAVYGNIKSSKEEDAIQSSVIVNGGYIINDNGVSALVVIGNGATLQVNDGVLKATNNPVVSGFSSDYNDVCDGTTVKIKGGKFIGQVSDDNFNNGYIACGVYQPQNGTLEISGGEFYIERGVGILTRSGKTEISGNAKVLVSGNYTGKVGDSDGSIPTVAVYNDLKAKFPGGAPSTEVSGGSYSYDVSEYLKNGYKVIWDDENDVYQVIDGSTTSYSVVNNELAIDEIAANSIAMPSSSSFDKDGEILVTSEIVAEGDKFGPEGYEIDFSEFWEESDEKKALMELLSKQENVSSVIPLGIVLTGIDASWNSEGIDELSAKANMTLFLKDETLNKINGKKLTVYRIYSDYDGNLTIVPVTDEKTTVVGNSIAFSSDKYCCIYAIVTYNDPTPTPTATSETKKSSGGWDDGGPFTTDTCGNVFDRWGNKIYEAKGCNVGGYNLVRTSVED